MEAYVTLAFCYPALFLLQTATLDSFFVLTVAAVVFDAVTV
jgi:hypothetical protein